MSNELRVTVTRSAKRRKTVAARLLDGGSLLEVLAPQGMTDAELAPIVEKLKSRLIRRRSVAQADSAALTRRATELNNELFGGALKWESIRYVSNQQKRLGSCSTSSRTIRLSVRAASLPSWVRDYILVHELAHLLEPNHGPRFWKLVYRYPLTERARGFIMGAGFEEDEEPSEADG
jgi:hypothetical protein